MATKKITEVDIVNSLSDSDTIFVNSGNSLKQVSKSNLVIKGDTGKSAYQYAVEGGYTGTETEFSEKLASGYNFYIDLTGEYPNYTCSVAMDDIKAAYNSGYNIVCRCAVGMYTATLPLFVPMPAANTWIFSGSGALAEMNFPAQSLTIAINNGTVLADNARLASKADIPTIPTALKNPNALTFTGAVTGTYDGSAPLSVAIPSGGSGESGGSEWQTILTGETTVEAVTTVTIPMTASDFNEYRAVIVVGKNTDGTTTNNNTNIWIDGYCCAYYMLSINYGNYNGTFSISVEPIPETRILNNNGSYTSCAKKSNVDWWMTSPYNGGSSGAKAIFCSNTSPTGVLQIKFGTAYSGTIRHEVMAR